MQFGLRTKLGLLIIVLLGASVSIAMLALQKMDSINSQISTMSGSIIPRLENSNVLKNLTHRMAVAQRTMFLDEHIERKLQASQENDDAIAQFSEHLKKSSKNEDENHSRSLDRIAQAFKQWSQLNTLTKKKIEERDLRGLSELAPRQEGLLQTLQAETTQILNNDKMLMDKISFDAETECANARASLNFILSAVVLFGLLFSFLIFKSLSKAIGKVAKQLNKNSARVASVAQDLTLGANEQTTLLSQTNESVMVMNELSVKNAQSAKHTSQISVLSDEAAQRGKQVVLQVIDAIAQIEGANTKIKQQVNDGNSQLGEIIQVIRGIAEKTKVINDIVLQTRLLSFNASLEAVRAGENGKGFAVVAEEVRALTQLTGNAAQDIGQMIQASLQKVESIVSETGQKVETLTHEGSASIETGTRIAAQCSQVLEEIVEHVSSVNKMSASIASMSEEQMNRIQGILKFVKAAQNRNSESVQSAKLTYQVGEELIAQAQVLHDVVTSLVFNKLKNKPINEAEVLAVNNVISLNALQKSESEDPSEPLFSKAGE